MVNTNDVGMEDVITLLDFTKIMIRASDAQEKDLELVLSPEEVKTFTSAMGVYAKMMA